MQRTFRGLVMALAFLVLAFGVAEAGKKKKKKKKAKVLAPVSITLANACKSPIKVMLDTHTFEIPATGEVAAQDIKAREDGSFSVKLGPTKSDLGYIGLFAGEKYKVSFSRCTMGVADITTENLSTDPPKNLSPQAAAKVRFRAQRLWNGKLAMMKYKAGNKAWRMLAIGFTKYLEQAPGDFAYNFHYKGAPGTKPLKRSAKLKPGHRYLFEAGVAKKNRKHVFVKFEDEGWIKEK